MNFEELYKKISRIDQGTAVTESLSECGCDVMPSTEHSQQPDSVNMNVSINGQGANGIRDLMNILRNIDDSKTAEIPHDMSPDDQEPTIVIGNDEEPEDDEGDFIDTDFVSHDDEHEEEPEMEFDFDEMYDEPIEEEMPDSYENSVDGAGGIPKIFKVAAITALGNDLNKSKKMYAKSNDGDNGMAVSESLVRNLHNLYNEVKHR